MDEIMYRNNDSFGAYEYDPINVITYEIYELGNIDCPDYCLENYGDYLSDELKDSLNELIEAGDDEEIEDNYDEDDINEIVTNLINELEENVFHEKINYVLWLASKEAVIDIYDGTEDNISGYLTSDIILDDLGTDGILFGYVSEPTEIKMD